MAHGGVRTRDRVNKKEEEGEIGDQGLGAGAQRAKPRWVPCRGRWFRKWSWHGAEMTAMDIYMALGGKVISSLLFHYCLGTILGRCPITTPISPMGEPARARVQGLNPREGEQTGAGLGAPMQGTCLLASGSPGGEPKNPLQCSVSSSRKPSWSAQSQTVCIPWEDGMTLALSSQGFRGQHRRGSACLPGVRAWSCLHYQAANSQEQGPGLPAGLLLSLAQCWEHRESSKVTNFWGGSEQIAMVVPLTTLAGGSYAPEGLTWKKPCQVQAATFLQMGSGYRAKESSVPGPFTPSPVSSSQLCAEDLFPIAWRSA